MSNQGKVRITVVNHNSVDIARPAAAVWEDILEMYVDGHKFSAQGHVVEPLQGDPAAYLGGYRMTLRGKDGTVLDDRACRITERDDATLRLSLCAEYFIPAELKLIVNASYQAIPTTSGSRYALDAYSMLDVSLPRDDSEPSVRQVAAQFQSESAGYLADFLRSVKDRLESAA